MEAVCKNAAMIDNFAEPTVGDYLRAIWRSKLWILAAAAIGAVAGAVLPIADSTSYASDVVLRVDSESLYVKALDLQITGLGATSATAEMTKALLPQIDSAVEERLGRSVSVSAAAKEGAGEVTFTSSASTADHAREDVETYVSTFVASRVDEQRTSVSKLVSALGTRAETLRGERLALEQRIAALPPEESQLAQALRSEFDALNVRIATVDDRVAALERFSDDTTAGLATTTSPTTPVASSGTSRPVRAAISFVLGAALAGLVILVRAFSDRSLRTRADVELTAPGVPVLGVVPAEGQGADGGWADAAIESIDRRLGSLDIGAGGAALMPAGRGSVERLADTLSGRLELRPTPSVIARNGTPADVQAPDAVVLVVRSGATTDDELGASLTRLRDAGVTVAGIVLDGVDRRSLPGAAISIGVASATTDAGVPTG